MSKCISNLAFLLHLEQKVGIADSF